MSNRSAALMSLLLAQMAFGAETLLAFPGAMGAAAAPGRRGGEIVKVTTLAPTGPGASWHSQSGGVIDLAEITLKITALNLTIAGQTADTRHHADSR